MLYRLSKAHVAGSPAPPILGLVDFDPDGVGILANYKYGSVKLAHENGHTNVSPLTWLGPRSADLPSPKVGGEDPIGLLRLTARDRKKALKILEGERCAENGPEQDWRRELQVMLMLNTKAEIQLLSTSLGQLEVWLETKLRDAIESTRRDEEDSLPDSLEGPNA